MAIKNFKFKHTMNLPMPKLKEEGDITPALQKKMKRALTAGLVRGTTLVMSELAIKLDEVMGSPVFEWSPTRKATDERGNPVELMTKRKNGDVVGSPRDIVDTGALAASLKIKESYLKSGAKILITYSAPYASMVYYGGVIQPYGNPKADSVTLPGRPWVKIAIDGGGGIEPFKPRASKLFGRGLVEAWRKEFGADAAFPGVGF